MSGQNSPEWHDAAPAPGSTAYPAIPGWRREQPEPSWIGLYGLEPADLEPPPPGLPLWFRRLAGIVIAIAVAIGVKYAIAHVRDVERRNGIDPLELGHYMGQHPFLGGPYHALQAFDRANYDQLNTHLLKEVRAGADGERLAGLVGEHLYDYIEDRIDVIAGASDGALVEIARRRLAFLAGIASRDETACAEYVVSPARGLAALTRDDHLRYGSVSAAMIQATYEGADRKARDTSRLAPPDEAAFRSAFNRQPLHRGQRALLRTPELIDQAAPADQCAIDLAERRAIVSLPAAQGARVMAYRLVNAPGRRPDGSARLAKLRRVNAGGEP